MSHDQKKKTRQVKFQDNVKVLAFNKKQVVRKLLGCGKKNIPLHKGESEFTKKRRNMKKGAKCSSPRERVRLILERQRDIEAQFCAAYCRQLWAENRRRVMGVVILKQTKFITTRVSWVTKTASIYGDSVGWRSVFGSDQGVVWWVVWFEPPFYRKTKCCTLKNRGFCNK